MKDWQKQQEQLYYKNLLGNILRGEHTKLEKIINSFFEDNEEISFTDLSISQAIEWLADNYDNYKEYIE